MQAFPEDVFAWLRDDSTVSRWGYFNASTNASAICAYTLIVDGEPSCKIDRDASQRIVDACWQGPWMSFVKGSFETPHMLSMEVQMNGSHTPGAWHVDSSEFRILTVAVPLNDAYNRNKGGCTEVCTEQGERVLLECGSNEFRAFDGSRLHRRTASTTKEWATRRRMVFIQFAASKQPWASVSAARTTHMCLKRKLINQLPNGSPVVRPDLTISKRLTRSQTGLTISKRFTRSQLFKNNTSIQK